MQLATLQRKYRIQKDRLITWGLEWSDGEKGADANIDDAVSKAGLTETVESVLRNIQEVTEEAERIQSASLPLIKHGETIPQKPAVFDEARYEDLLRDLTTSIDILYDLTTSRRALARGEHPTFEEALETVPPELDEPSNSKPKSTTKSIYGAPSFASSGTTLHDPPFAKPFLSPYAGLPSRIEVSALRLPSEGPPPYEAVGVPSTTRMVALLIRKKVPESVHNAIASSAPEVPVLVEYANYDSTYRETGVPPPLQRLESLLTCFQPMRPDSTTNLSLLGYFEDGDRPRIGLVYDLPYAIQNRLQTGGSTEPLTPLSLLKLVQKQNKAQSSATEVPSPPLESRFKMALRLTEQLHALHSRQLPHGNINSSSIIFTTTANQTESSRLEQLRKPLWASFDLFSKCNTEGTRRPTNFNIYRHPLDEPSSANREFALDLKYDLYGLGVILLEIGLWMPIGDLYKAKYTLADFKIRLEKIWIPKLAAKCGSAYMRAAETCLRLSDSTDTSSLTVEGVYGLLLQFLKRCCLLDDVGSSLELIPASELISEPSSPMQPYRMPARKQIRRPSEASSIARQLSEPLEHARTLSVSAMSSTTPYRHNTLPNPATATAVPQLSRPPTKMSLMSSRQSLYDMKDQIKGRPQSGAQSSPSFRDFKRRVTFIQQRWRECRAIRAEQGQNQDARESIDMEPGQRHKVKREEYPDLEIPQDIVQHWETQMCFKMKKLLERALYNSPESSSIRLCQYGTSRETAKPALIIGCKSTAKVKHAIKRHLKYDPSLYDIRVKKEGVIRRSRRSRKERALDTAERSMAPYRDPNVAIAVNPDYQERPSCGASIGAYRYDEHLPPVSYGGVVLIDGTPYGMSVHHMLEPQDDSDLDDDDDDAGADDESETSSLGGSSEDSEDEDQSTVRPPSLRSDDEDDIPSASDTVGDCPGIEPGDMEEIAITQPALDDAIDLDLHAEEDEDDEDEDADSAIDEDHLLSYRLGQVYVSSGLRRTAKSHEGGFKSISQSLPQEIDWALFELHPPRLHPFNVVKGGKRHCTARSDGHGNSFPASVRKSDDLACAKVHCLGRTSGLGHGTISSTMEIVKIHGRSTFSASWTVAGNFGVGGDSGAWVVSNDDGTVCGHVLASRQGRTYICPMDLLLDDIKAATGASEVRLPVFGEMATSRPNSRKGEEQNQNVADAISKMRLSSDHHHGGGVALPASPVRCSTARTVEPV